MQVERNTGEGNEWKTQEGRGGVDKVGKTQVSGRGY